MGISVLTQEDLGFDSSNSLQPVLGNEHTAAPRPGCPLKWVPRDGKKPMEMGCPHTGNGSGKGKAHF